MVNVLLERLLVEITPVVSPPDPPNNPDVCPPPPPPPNNVKLILPHAAMLGVI